METAACQAAVEVRLGKTAEAPSRLTELATEINASHERVVGKARETLEHAKRTGELLIGVKAKLGHCQWLRQAQRYMAIAENWPALVAKYDTMSHLSVAGALRLIGGKSDTSELAALGDSDLLEMLNDGSFVAMCDARIDELEAVA
jgi:hypothetical protein